MTVDEMEMTVGEFYRRTTEEIPIVDLALDNDLKNIFDASSRSKRRGRQKTARVEIRNW